jgi:hypothetical protein
MRLLAMKQMTMEMMGIVWLNGCLILRSAVTISVKTMCQGKINMSLRLEV